MKKLLLITTLILSGFCFAQAPTNGLVAFYDFENTLNSNQPAHSFTNGTATNVTYAAGKLGQGVAFAGASALINTSMVASANLNTNCTIAWWEFRGGVNPALNSYSVSLRNSLKYSYTGTSNCVAGGPIYYDRYRLEYFTSTNGFCQTLNTHNSGGQGGAWHHHAITKEGTVVKYYLDGVLAWTPATGMNQDNSLMAVPNTSFVFGSDSNANGTVDTNRCMNGTLDELYVYQRALTAAEIVTVKNSTALGTAVAATPILKFEFNNSLSNVGNTVTLTDTNSQTPTGVVYTSDRYGNNNSALSMFNKCYIANAYTLPTGKNQRTVSFWLNRAGLYGNYWAWGNPADNRSYGLKVNGVIGFSNYGYGTGNDVSSTSMGATDSWEHYVFTYDGLNVAIYRNGTLLASGTKPAWDTLGNVMIFGSDTAYTSSANWLGNFKIDDFEVYNTFFNSTEVATLYNAQNVAASTPPTAATPQTFCGPATVANLAATGTNLKWYNVATGGTALATTAAINTGTYYVSQTQTGLTESTRVAVSVSVTAAPAAPVTAAQGYCNGATVANLISSGTNVRWYDVATGGTPLPTTTLLVTGNYYVSQVVGTCESARTLSSVTIVTTPPPTAPANQSFCAGTPISYLAATGTALKWYASATGGSYLDINLPLTTGNYYVSQTPSSNCESARTMVTVTVNPIPAAPAANSQSLCTGATVADLTASGAGLKWYNVASGGTVLPTTTALANGNYYVSQTTSNCESTRTMVAVTINPIPAAPSSQTTQTFCGTATVADLTATGTSLKWYTTATGGTPLTASTALAIGSYYVSQTTASCESTRTLIFVNINPIPAAPASNSQSFCNSATVADLTASGTTLKWYPTATGGTVLPTTTALATGNYYVSQTTSNCESARTMVAVTVNTVAAPTGSANQTFVIGATISNLLVTGTSVVWFATLADANANVNPLANTTVMTNNATYYATQTISGCRSTSTLAVTVSLTLATANFNTEFGFSIYPNPAADYATIEMETEVKSVEIYSLHGQKMLSGSSKQLHVGELPAGIYLVHIQDENNNMATRKLVVE